MNYPKWKSHKVVEAAKIEGIERGQNGVTMLRLECGFECTVVVSAHYMTKHEPEVGGYWVRYVDGYESYSPAEAFEGGYTQLPFGE